MLNGEVSPSRAIDIGGEREADKIKRIYPVRFASAVPGRRLAESEVPDELCTLIFEALSRSEEIAVTDRDHWGGLGLAILGRATTR